MTNMHYVKVEELNSEYVIVDDSNIEFYSKLMEKFNQYPAYSEGTFKRTITEDFAPAMLVNITRLNNENVDYKFLIPMQMGIKLESFVR